MGQVENEGARRRRARIRKTAFVTAIAALAIAAALLALYFAPLCARYAEGPSAEEAVEWADRGAGGEYAFSLEREYVDGEGRTVYRLVSGSEPVVVMEARYGFRWASGSLVVAVRRPRLHRPRPRPVLRARQRGRVAPVLHRVGLGAEAPGGPRLAEPPPPEATGNGGGRGRERLGGRGGAGVSPAGGPGTPTCAATMPCTPAGARARW